MVMASSNFMALTRSPSSKQNSLLIPADHIRIQYMALSRRTNIRDDKELGISYSGTAEFALARVAPGPGLHNVHCRWESWPPPLHLSARSWRGRPFPRAA